MADRPSPSRGAGEEAGGPSTLAVHGGEVRPKPRTR